MIPGYGAARGPSAGEIALRGTWTSRTAAWPCRRADGQLPFAALAELDYVDRCFREALRVSPPVGFVIRRTVEACPVAGHQLPARTPLVLDVRSPHIDPRLWTEPQRFDPEHFGPDRTEGEHTAWIEAALGLEHEQVDLLAWASPRLR